MDESELRSKEVKTSFTIVHKNHCELIKHFEKHYLSKIESLDEEEYFNMKSWINEYDRIVTILQQHLINFEKYSHEVEHPDKDDLIKKAVTLGLVLSFNKYPKYNLYQSFGQFDPD